MIRLSAPASLAVLALILSVVASAVLFARVSALDTEVLQLREQTAQLITCRNLSHLSIVSSDSHGDSFALGEWSNYGFGASANHWTLPRKCRQSARAGGQP